MRDKNYHGAIERLGDLIFKVNQAMELDDKELMEAFILLYLLGGEDIKIMDIAKGASADVKVAFNKFRNYLYANTEGDLCY